MIHCINKKIESYYKKKWKPKIYREPTEKLKNLFSEGEGLYLVCIESKNNNIVSKAISFFSGKYSHTVTVLHTKNKDDWFDLKEEGSLARKVGFFYNSLLYPAIENLVLASADDVGMNYFDFSHYQGRKFKIRKMHQGRLREKQIAEDFISRKVMDTPYDYTGLAFWWLNRAMDDEKAFYCSEVHSDIFRRNGKKISKDKNPSPTQIVKYFNNWIDYDGEK